jgi:hypothetical protein
VKRAAHFAARALAIEFLGLLQRIAIYGDDPIQVPVVQSDSRQILKYEIARCNAPLLHLGLHLGDAGLNDAKRRLRYSEIRGFVLSLPRQKNRNRQQE